MFRNNLGQGKKLGQAAFPCPPGYAAARVGSGEMCVPINPNVGQQIMPPPGTVAIPVAGPQSFQQAMWRAAMSGRTR